MRIGAFELGELLPEPINFYLNVRNYLSAVATRERVRLYSGVLTEIFITDKLSL